MSDIKDIVKGLHKNQKDVRFKDLKKVCDHYFSEPRISGSDHIYKTPWKGDPRINIQKSGNKAKAYQVKQVLKAIDKLLAD